MSSPSTTSLTSKLAHLVPTRATTSSSSDSASERATLVNSTKADFSTEQKHKELIMKYRNLNAEEADQYLALKDYGRSGGGRVWSADAWMGLAMSLSCA